MLDYVLLTIIEKYSPSKFQYGNPKKNGHFMCLRCWFLSSLPFVVYHYAIPTQHSPAITEVYPSHCRNYITEERCQLLFTIVIKSLLTLHIIVWTLGKGRHDII